MPWAFIKASNVLDIYSPLLFDFNTFTICSNLFSTKAFHTLKLSNTSLVFEKMHPYLPLKINNEIQKIPCTTYGSSPHILHGLFIIDMPSTML